MESIVFSSLGGGVVDLGVSTKICGVISASFIRGSSASF